MMRSALIGIGLLLAGLSGTPAFAAKNEFPRPPYAGAYEPQGVDERGLWMQFDELERGLRDMPMVVRDARLNGYVRSVLCKTVGFDRCTTVRIYLVKDRSANATMAPNGLMQVHTGMLARLHSEAELAAVLGHEFAHFELRHSLNGFRNRRRGSDWLSWVMLAGAATNQSTTDIQSGIIAGLFAFNRAQETEADLLSAAYVRSSPYRLAASSVWKRFIQEEDALRAERKLKKIRRLTPAMTDTHPTDLQRIGYFSKLEAEAVAQGSLGDDGIDDYRASTGRNLSDLFESLIKGNEFSAADFVIQSRGDALGWDGQLLSLRAELYRQRAAPRDLAVAREMFEKATAYRDAPSTCWRGLGLTEMRLGDVEAGRSALREYLKREPDAQDARAIQILLES